MRLFDGNKIADGILLNLKKEITNRRKKPGLAVVLVGDNPASQIYVNLKAKVAKKVGIGFKLLKFSERANEDKIIAAIKQLNRDKSIYGMIVQLPLPKKFHTQKIINSIDPQKDVDGFHPDNVKKFLAGHPTIYPVFPQAIMKLLGATGKKMKGKSALIIANSKKFGSVMQQALEFEKTKAKYILSKNLNKNLDLLKKTDIIVTAVGKPGLIRGNMLKKGVTIIDGGITKVENKVQGDVAYNSVKPLASYLSPVPGGVGPVTISCLLQNVYNLAKNSIKAVIFDMDGVVSDTEKFHAEIEKEMFKKYNITIDMNEITDKYSGVPVNVIFQEIFNAHKVSVDIDKVVEEKQRLMFAKSRGHIKPVSGVLNLIKKIQKKGLKISLGTSSQKKLTNLILSELSLKNIFKIAITVDDVKKGKPSPDIFLLAAKKMGVNPEECLVIEDGRSGMLAAKCAGMKCIGLVKNKHSKNYPADILVESLNEIKL